MTIYIQSTTLHSEKYPTTDHYPFNLPLFHETQKILFQTPVTLFAGENGAGKSTLLEAIARTCGIYCPKAAIYNFDHSPIEHVAYEDTEHFQIYKNFMEDRGRYI